MEEFQKIKKEIVYIGNIPLSASKKDIFILFKSYGEIFTISENKNLAVKTAYVRFNDPESAKKCLEINNTTYRQSILIVKKMGMPYSYYLLPVETTVVVRNFGKSTELKAIQDTFQCFGELSCILKRSDTFLFVSFCAKESAQIALSQSIVIDGCPIKVGPIYRNINCRLFDIEYNINKTTEAIIKQLVYTKRLASLSPPTNIDISERRRGSAGRISVYTRCLGVFGLSQQTTETCITELFSK